MEQKKELSIVMGGQTYKGGLLYWGIIAVVTGIFLFTTIHYYYGTVAIIEESNKVLPIARPPKSTTP